MKEAPYTIGYDIDKAHTMLEGYKVVIDETSTVFQDKKEERKDNIAMVVRQLQEDGCVRLTVARFR